MTLGPLGSRARRAGALAVFVAAFALPLGAARAALEPQLVSTTPPDGGAARSSLAAVSATYDRDIAATSTIELRDTTSTLVAGSATVSGPTISFAPQASLSTGGSPYRATVVARPAVAGDPTTTRFSFSIDDVEPDTTIDSGPPALTRATEATFALASNETGVAFECSLDGAAFAACPSPHTVTGLADGAHTFAARAVDRAANTDATPASHSWTIDSVPPSVTIDAAPAETVASSEATFAFSSADTSATFRCRLDDGSATACTSPLTFSGLGEGGHSFSVTPEDPAGNTGDAATHTWTIDLTAPDVTIDGGPSGSVASQDASFTFSSTDVGAAFRCGLDGAAETSCTSPHMLTGLGEGTHTFGVRAVDELGNVGDAATRIWTVDVTAPDTTISSTPPSLTNARDASFTFAADEAGVMFDCRLDGGALATCAGSASYTDLGEGSHTFEVTGTDAAGNTDASPATYTWTIDLTPPSMTAFDGPSGTVASRDAEITFETDDPTASFRCALDDAADAPCTSPVSLSGLAEGLRTYTVRAYDPAGNASDPEAASWTVDVTGPGISITGGPSGTVPSRSATFTFASTESDATTECSLDAAAFAACTSPHALQDLSSGEHTFAVRAIDAVGNVGPGVSRTWTIDLGPVTLVATSPADRTLRGEVASVTATFSRPLASGTLEVSNRIGTIVAGIVGTDGSTVTFTPAGGPLPASGSPYTAIASAAPADDGQASGPQSFGFGVGSAPAFTAPAPDALVGSTGVGIAGTADPGASVVLREGAAQLASLTATDDGTWSTGMLLAEGSHTVAATASDAAGNASEPVSRSFTVDVTAPGVPQIVAPAAGTLHPDLVTVSGTAETGSTVTIYEGERIVGTAATTASGWSARLAFSEGAHAVRALATDGAGNASARSAATSFEVDATKPVVVVTTSDRTVFMPDQATVLEGRATDNRSVALVSVEYYDVAGRLVLRDLPAMTVKGDGEVERRSAPRLITGYYTVKVSATDGVANRSHTVSRTFVRVG